MNSINNYNNQTLLSHFKQRKANNLAPHFTSNTIDNTKTQTNDTKQNAAKAEKKKKLKTIAVIAAAIFAAYMYISAKSTLGKYKLPAEFVENFKNKTNAAYGENYFEDLMAKAGWEKGVENGDWQTVSSNIKPNSFIKDLATTVTDVFGLGIDAINNISKKINNNYQPKGIFKSRIAHNEKANARDSILRLVELFNHEGKNAEQYFSSISTSLESKSINYKSRDERTLTRLTSGAVSTIFAGTDFFNISMLQKDDEKEAKKSAKAREKQEMTRYAINAAVTFGTLGAFDKYIRNSTALTILVSGLSALFSEVVSRLFSHTPLTPLTPEEAKNIALKRKAKEAKTENKDNAVQNQKTTQQPTFKANLNSQVVFKDFAKSDGTFASLNLQNKNIKNQITDSNQTEQAEQNEPKKKNKLVKTVAIISALLSAYYIFSNTSKGKEVIEGIDKKLHLSDIKDFITTKKRKINASELVDKINTVIGDKTLEELSGPERILYDYKDVLTGKNSTGQIFTEVTVKDKKLLSGSLYKGFEKMAQTIISIFSLPGKILFDGFSGIKKLIENQKIDPSAAIENASLSETINTTRAKVLDDYKGGINELDKLFKKYGNEPDKILDEIAKRTRNVKTDKNSSILNIAHSCRTIVTMIGTYFFVNDYRNKVLIESEGKDIEGANEQMKERLAHKIANFAINGTLMNLFNSLFEGPMNANIFIASGVAALTELCNETIVRFSICSPRKRMKSRQDIIDFNEKQENQKGLKGLYVKAFKKLTGKKNIIEKSGIQAKN